MAEFAWQSSATIVSILICSCLFYILYQRFGSGLRSIPGPFVASFTDLWSLLAVYDGRFERTLQALHDKYGNLVRVGPNSVSVADPTEIRQIYSISRLFQKSEMYRVAQPLINGKPVASLFMMIDEDQHKAAKRPIVHAYSMTSVLDYEPFVDSTSRVLVDLLTKQYADTSRICDFGELLQWYAFDVIGEMTFSTSLGFLEHQKDVGNIIRTLHKFGAYVAVIGQMPWLDQLLAKNRFWGHFFSGDILDVPKFVLQFLKPRLEQADRLGTHGEEKRTLDFADRTDFTAKFISAFDKNQGAVPQSQLLGWSLTNINAGSDTTAITLRAIFHFLMLHPPAMSKLKTELDGANLSPLPQWRETSNLPYLTAVIKEALRLHTPAGFILERIVPEGGVTLCGHFFPQGTIVGCNPAIIHKDKGVYGRRYSVNEFHPERWIEADEEEKAEMERCNMAFGAGKRICLGRNVSLLEIHKLVPLLLQRFKLRLVEPEKPLHILNRFFVHQTGLNVYIEKA